MSKNSILMALAAMDDEIQSINTEHIQCTLKNGDMVLVPVIILSEEEAPPYLDLKEFQKV